MAGAFRPAEVKPSALVGESAAGGRLAVAILASSVRGRVSGRGYEGVVGQVRNRHVSALRGMGSLHVMQRWQSPLPKEEGLPCCLGENRLIGDSVGNAQLRHCTVLNSSCI